MNQGFIIQDRHLAFLGRMVLYLCIFAYPIIACIKILSGVQSNLLSIGFRAVYLAISLVLIGLYFLHSKVIRLNWGMWFLIFFWVVYIIRMVYDLDIRQIPTFSGHEPSYFYLFGIGGCFFPAVAMYLIADKINYNDIVKYFWWLALIPVVGIGYLIYSEFGFNMEVFAMRMALGRDDGQSSLNPIMISQSGVMFAIISLYFVFFKKKILLSKISFFSFFLIGVVMAIIGASRGPLLNLFLISLFIFLHHFFITKKGPKYYIKFMVFVGILLFGISAVAVNTSEEDFILAKRIESGNEQIAGGKDPRSVVWSSAMDQFYTNPILGDRFLEKKTNQYPHNIFIEVLMATGMIGGLFFYTSFVWVLKNIVTSFLNYDSKSILIFFILSAIIFSLFSGALYDAPAFWILMAIFLKKKVNN